MLHVYNIYIYIYIIFLYFIKDGDLNPPRKANGVGMLIKIFPRIHSVYTLKITNIFLEVFL